LQITAKSLPVHSSESITTGSLVGKWALKMQDWKMTDESAGLENTGLENNGLEFAELEI